MDIDQLRHFSGTFADAQRERQFIAHAWPQYSQSLRMPLILLGVFVSAGLYLDHMWYAFGPHFLAFGLFRVSVSLAACLVVWLCYRPHKPAAMDALVALLQSYFLLFIFAVFYDRMFLNNNGIVSESFFTVMFVTYPLLVFYVVRGNILYALLNSLLALAIYIAIIEIMPQINLRNRITEVLVFMFFIYYSFTLQRRLNTEERTRFSLQERQETAIALAKKESLEKSRFIAGTSHDLRQPLHALSLHIDLLDGHLGADHAASESLQHAKSSISSLNELLSALLDISKFDAGAVTINAVHFRLDPLLEKLQGVYDKLAASQGMRIRLRNPCRVAYTDPIILERALGNLLNNAIQHAGQGDILLASRQRGDHLVIEVWDQGPGIPANQLERIFSEYQQLESAQSERRGGLGLGLSIVRRICDSLGLGLKVRSRPGRGSVFSIAVPVGDNARVETPDHSRPAISGALTLRGRRLLLIDDDVEVRHAMASLFGTWGCETLIARDRDDLFSRLSPEEVPDLIISDLNLPGEIDGDALVREIRDYYARPIPGLIITGNTGDTAEEQEDGNTLMRLYKPLRATQLRLAIVHALQDRQH
ncbi:MAG: hybrid sensor histidine kinase/response regulator [Pseudomonadales bacterium]|nr:hybrid sensor histidine kinase/response regulator [Pseudomonadales bacterium]